MPHLNWFLEPSVQLSVSHYIGGKKLGKFILILPSYAMGYSDIPQQNRIAFDACMMNKMVSHDSIS